MGVPARQFVECEWIAIQQLPNCIVFCHYVVLFLPDVISWNPRGLFGATGHKVDVFIDFATSDISTVLACSSCHIRTSQKKIQERMDFQHWTLPISTLDISVSIFSLDFRDEEWRFLWFLLNITSNVKWIDFIPTLPSMIRRSIVVLLVSKIYGCCSPRRLERIVLFDESWFCSIGVTEPLYL